MTQIMKSSLGIFLTLGLILTSAPSRAFDNVSDLSVRGEQTLESLKDGAPITTIGWTGKNAVNILGATSRLEEEQKVMQAGGAERQSALSPVQEINPPFASDETVFFATFIQRTGKASSGVRLRLQGNSGETITGFGAADTIVDSLAGRLCLLEHDNSWKFSEKVAAPGTWYEIVLILKQKDGKSLASLYIRNVSAGQGHFEPVEDLQNIEIAGGAEAAAFANWRIENFRVDAQLGPLRAGVVKAP
jgi:hypothetical protein